MAEFIKGLFHHYDAARVFVTVFLLWISFFALLYLAKIALGLVAKHTEIGTEKWRARLNSLKDQVYMLGFLAVVGSGVLIAVDTYVDHFGNRPMSTDPEQWGQMGDFFGGMLNPILAFASFIALLYTIQIQSEELRLTKEEFAKSSKAQQEIADTAKAELTNAQKQFSTQIALQIVQPFLNKVSESLAKCEGILSRKIKTNDNSDEVELEQLIKKYAASDDPHLFSKRLLIQQNYQGLNTLEVENALTELASVFREIWNAVFNVDKVLIEAGLEETSTRLFGLTANQVAKIGAYLHATEKFKQPNIVDPSFQFGNDPLLDDYVQRAKMHLDELNTSL